MMFSLQTWPSRAVSAVWDCLDTYPDQDIFIEAMSGIIEVCYNAIAETDVTGSMLSEDTVLNIVKSLDRVLAHDHLRGEEYNLEAIERDSTYRYRGLLYCLCRILYIFCSLCISCCPGISEN